MQEYQHAGSPHTDVAAKPAGRSHLFSGRVAIVVALANCNDAAIQPLPSILRCAQGHAATKHNTHVHLYLLTSYLQWLQQGSSGEGFAASIDFLSNELDHVRPTHAAGQPMLGGKGRDTDLPFGERPAVEVSFEHALLHIYPASSAISSAGHQLLPLPATPLTPRQGTVAPRGPLSQGSGQTAAAFGAALHSCGNCGGVLRMRCCATRLGSAKS